jgi:hypothetical protein
VNTPTNTHDASTADPQGGLPAGTIMPNDCYVAGKTAFTAGFTVRDCPHTGPNGQAWLRGWHVARLMARLTKHIGEHSRGVL